MSRALVLYTASPAPSAAAGDGPVLMAYAPASAPARGYRIPPPPASAVRLTVPALVVRGVTSVLDTAPRKRHVAAECDFCLTGERHPAQMF